MLVVLLIGLPLFLIAAGGTFAYTKDVSPREGITRTMGTGQASLFLPGGQLGPIVQDANGVSFGQVDGREATPVPHFAGDPKHPTAADVQRVTGGTVEPVTHTQSYVVLGSQSVPAAVLGIDGRSKAYAGMSHLTSGRWPQTSDEVLVSRAGAARGIPTHGTLVLHEVSGAKRTLRVVGRVDTPNAESLVTLPAGRATSWILMRNSPVRWPEVKSLNRYGIEVASRAVINHPAEAKADPDEQFVESSAPVPLALFILLGTGLVVVIALLAGPAFATSGSRHRRALGQLASNGASRSQLRRYVLAQALLLGALSAVIGIAVGAVLGGIGASLLVRLAPSAESPGPTDLRWGWGLILLAVAVFASLVAAFLPAVAASRVNLIAVLRGHISVAKVHVGWPVAGLLVAITGGVVLTAALGASQAAGAESSPPVIGGITVGSIALFAGVLMTAPWLLARLGLVAGHLPLPLRVSARDISRQRGRAVATTGAILATVAVLTTMSITVASNTRAQQDSYQPMLPAGQAMLTSDTGGVVSESSARLVRDRLPKASFTRLRAVGVPDPSMEPPKPGSRVRLTTGFQSERCTSATALEAGDGSACHTLFGGVMGDQLIAASPQQLGRVFQLSNRDIAALSAGSALFPRGGARSGLPLQVVSGTGRYAADDSVDQVRLTGHAAIPVATSRQSAFVMVDQKKRNDGATGTTYGASVASAALISSRAAVKLPAPTYLTALMVRNPGGIPRTAADTITDHLNNSTGSTSGLYVERGYPAAGDSWIWLLISAVFGGLVLVATLTSTALSNAESRADSATFASLGAPSRLRRLIAGSNAALVGLFGALLGLVVGGVAGFGASRPATQSVLGRDHVLFVVPWGTLLTVTIGVPLLAGALAAVATRGRVPMTRRVT